MRLFTLSSLVVFISLAAAILALSPGPGLDADSLLLLALLVCGWLLVLATGLLACRRATPGRDVLSGQTDAHQEGSDPRDREQELVRARQRAEAESERRRLLLRRIGDLVVKPLNDIIGAGELAMRADSVEGKAPHLVTIVETSQALAREVQTNIGHENTDADTRGMTLKMAEFDPAALLEAVIESIAPEVEAKGVRLSVDVSEDLPRTVLGDRERVYQVILSMARFSLEAIASGEASVHMNWQPITSHAGFLRLLTVIDNPDVDHGRLHRVLEAPIEDLHAADGLGLLICRRLASLMNGAVSLTTDLDAGIECRLRLGKTFSSQEDALAVPPALTRLSVLVADDNSLSRDIIAATLAELGIQSVTVNSGEAAMTAIRERDTTPHPFDVLIIDWRMPGMDGVRVAEHLRADTTIRRQPVVILASAYRDDDEIASRDLNGVVDAILSKPLSREVLVATLGDCANVGGTQAAQPEGTEASDITGLRVLLAEDSFINQQMVLEVLREAGVETILANNGLEALARLEESVPDLVLMDVEMPEMGGIEATRRLRQQPELAKLPVIAMTAHAMPEDEASCLRAGMNDFVSKPVDSRMLKALLQHWSAAQPGTAANPAPDAQSIIGNRTVNDLHERLERDFRQANQDLVERARSMLSAGRAAEAAALVHTAKGEAASLGYQDMAEACAQLEHCMQNSGNCRDALIDLDRCIDRLFAPD